MRGRIGCLCLLLLAAAAQAQEYAPPPPPPPAPPAPPAPRPRAPGNPNLPQSEPTARGPLAPPAYPESALCQNIGGEVILNLMYNKDGRVRSVSVMRSSGTRALDRAAHDAAIKWRINPGLYDGVPSPGAVQIPVRFEPESDRSACSSDLWIDGLRVVGKAVSPKDWDDEVRGFDPGDTVSVELDFAFAPASKEKQHAVDIYWFRGGNRYKEVARQAVLLDNDGKRRAQFSHAEVGAWVPGLYEVVVVVGGEVHGTTTFYIEGEPPRR